VVVELLDRAQHGLRRLFIEREHGRRVRAVGEAASGEQLRHALRSRGEPPLSAAVVAGDVDDELPLGKAQRSGLCAQLGPAPVEAGGQLVGQLHEQHDRDRGVRVPEVLMRNVKPTCRESGACCGAIRGRGWRVLTIVFSSMRLKAAFSSPDRLASYARRSATIRSPTAIRASAESLLTYSFSFIRASEVNLEELCCSGRGSIRNQWKLGLLGGGLSAWWGITTDF